MKIILKLGILVVACGIFTFNLLEVNSGKNSFEDLELTELLKSASASASGESSMNGRPLMSNGNTYCCKNSGNDCGAARC